MLRFARLVLIIMVAMATLLSAHPAQANPIIIYVNAAAAGANDGSSWANAYTSLQTALTNASANSELWVAAGTYRPVEANGDRNATFQLKNGVAIYGGFAGSETMRSQRDWNANLTLLSGDLNGDDGADFANNSENSYHVVTGATGATLDGVTISGGNADGTSPANRGGGMYNNGSSPTLANVIFSGNSASVGGGMFNSTSNPTLTNVIFSGNSASIGGGMSTIDSNPMLTNVTFSGNGATIVGGGMYLSSSNPTLINVSFSGNSAALDGGGMYNVSSSPTLTNVIISGNSALNQGGGICDALGSPILTNVTISGNSAAEGSGMYNLNSTPIIRNSILWGNSGNQIEGAPVTISSSIVEGSIGSNPLFVNPISSASAPTTTGNLRLLPASPAINAGNNADLPGSVTTDRDGNPRTIGGTVDMGAYEVQSPAALSIARAGASPANAATVAFTVTFNMPVSGVDASDFTLAVTGVSGASVTDATTADGGKTWTATVNTGSGAGTLGLNLVDDDSIRATPDQPLGGAGAGNGDVIGAVYTIDRATPPPTEYTVMLPLVVR